jgi:hypothetical protein
MFYNGEPSETSLGQLDRLSLDALRFVAVVWLLASSVPGYLCLWPIPFTYLLSQVTVAFVLPTVLWSS